MLGFAHEQKAQAKWAWVRVANKNAVKSVMLIGLAQ